MVPAGDAEDPGWKSDTTPVSSRGGERMANSPTPVQFDAAPGGAREWPRRYTVVALFALATALCYLDRDNISTAIIPPARAKGYDAAAKGLALSEFFWGYLWLQLLGGWMADRFGGKRVLAA